MLPDVFEAELIRLCTLNQVDWLRHDHKKGVQKGTHNPSDIGNRSGTCGILHF